MGLHSSYNSYLINASNAIAPNIEGAIKFFREHIVGSNSSLDPLLKKYQFKSQVPSWKFELLAAILVGDIKKSGYGHDLLYHEVKSSMGGSFDYHYYRKSWKTKLEQEKGIDHIFISYSENFKVKIYRLESEQLQETLDSWERDIAGRVSDVPNIDYRQALSLGFVKANGELIMQC